jgi:hypothetical protein
VSKIEKLKHELKSRPKTFSYLDARRILIHEGYEENPAGKTSGSRVRFINVKGEAFTLHRPHPGNQMKHYSIIDLADFLEDEGKI